tara:strand:- start:695 stop:985 length:291 start_codon:yes stop_codon:yes gene_type:complete
MATYTYKCKECDDIKNVSISIKEFQALSKQGLYSKLFCNVCSNNQNFIRIFGPTSSKISKDKEALMEDIKNDARKIVEKVRAGDEKVIREVYGEDL